MNKLPIDKIHHKLSESSNPFNYQTLNKQILNSKQAIYVVDFKLKKFSYQKNINKLLGYNKEEFDFDHLISYVHPEDFEVYKRLITAIVNLTTSKEILPVGSGLNVSYRIKKKDGNYIRVLRTTTVLEVDTNQKMISNLSILTEIDFLPTNNEVCWELLGINHNITSFKKEIKKSFNDLFSKRELEIIKLLKKGFNTIEIAAKLFISKHTVHTHKKNMFKKAGVNNVVELINFTQKNQII